MVYPYSGLRECLVFEWLHYNMECGIHNVTRPDKYFERLPMAFVGRSEQTGDSWVHPHHPSTLWWQPKEIKLV